MIGQSSLAAKHAVETFHTRVILFCWAGMTTLLTVPQVLLNPTMRLGNYVSAFHAYELLSFICALVVWHCTPLRTWRALGSLTCFMAVSFVSLGGLNKPRLEILPSIWGIALIFTCYIVLLSVATAIYRLSRFHPLNSFPGPVLMSLTNIKLALLVASGYRYLSIQALHKKYGKFVRIGPNKISIASSTVLHEIYKSSRCMDKSNAYALGPAAGKGLFFIQGREEHARRRAMWAPAFTSAMIEKHQPVLDDTISGLSECITRRTDIRGVVDLSHCLQHWSFDFMGHLVFGPSSSFDLMQKGDKGRLVYSGQLAMATFEILGEVPWLFKVLWYLPMTKAIHSLHMFAASMAEKRKTSAAPDVPDICSYLLGEPGTGNRERLTDEELAMDTLFAIQAGSDTTSGILTFTFFYLLSAPEAYRRLQNELDEAFPGHDGSEPVDTASLHRLPFLDAVIKESLRLGTPFGGLARVVPRGGTMLDGVYVPQGTVVSVPVYAQHVSEANFWPEPESFIPDRWLPGGLGPGSTLDDTAFFPFSFGPFGCLGKNLAMRELFVVTARLVLMYDMSFAPDFDPHDFKRHIQNMKTTIFTAPLTVVAKPR